LTLVDPRWIDAGATDIHLLPGLNTTRPFADMLRKINTPRTYELDVRPAGLTFEPSADGVPAELSVGIDLAQESLDLTELEVFA